MTTHEVVVDTTHEVVVGVDDASITVEVGGSPGPPGQGVAPGGSTGQVLTKSSGVDFDTEWAESTGGGGGGAPSGPAGGDLAGSYPNPQIAAGVITDADVSASANIAQSKIGGLTASLSSKAAAATTITAGTGLTGGGDLTANRTLSLDVAFSDTRYVNVNGDVLTGALLLAGDPATGLQAATKQYVDSKTTSVAPVRESSVTTTTSLADNATWTGSVRLAEAYRLFQISTSHPCRVRLYTTPAKRDADAARAVGTDPVGDHGLMLDFVTTAGDLDWDLTPMVDGFDGKTTTDGYAAALVTNLSGGTATVTVTLGFLAAEGVLGAATGPPGPPNVLTIGTVLTGSPGTSASATITGSSPSQVLGLSIPRGDVGATGVGAPGDDGPPNVLTIGTVTTGAAGSSAAANITGTSPSQVLSLTIPRGDKGDKGDTGSGGGGVMPGYLALDSMTGANDDAKLTAAMSQAAAQTYPPTILLSNRLYTFSTARTLYDGFSLQGPAGMGNAELGAPRIKCEARVNVSNGVWLSSNAAECWDVTIRNVAFTSTNNTTQFLGGSASYWCLNLRDCSWAGFKSVLGSQSSSMLMTLCLLDGWLSFNDSRSGAIHIGGSDNSLFQGMTNIDSDPAFHPAGAAQYHVWFDWCEKSDIGPIYVTAENKWGGIKVEGPSINTYADNCGGALFIRGAKIEGRNTNQPCYGAPIRLEGGGLVLRDSWLGFGMSSPSSMGNSPADAGIVHAVNAQVVLSGCVYDRTSGQPETTPLLYLNGGTANVNTQMIATSGGTWSGKPRVRSVAGTLTVDSSVTQI